MSSLSAIAEGLKLILDGAGVADATPGMRNAGDPLPAVTYEIVSGECVRHMPAAESGVWIIGAEVNIYADTTLALLGFVDDVLDEFNGTVTSNTVDFVCTGYSFSIRTETQADGAEGDERVATIAIQLQVGV
jgi:hypothetical protein